MIHWMSSNSTIKYQQLLDHVSLTKGHQPVYKPLAVTYQNETGLIGNRRQYNMPNRPIGIILIYINISQKSIGTGTATVLHVLNNLRVYHHVITNEPACVVHKTSSRIYPMLLPQPSQQPQRRPQLPTCTTPVLPMHMPQLRALDPTHQVNLSPHESARIINVRNTIPSRVLS